MSDPAPLLGLTRHRNTERMSLREMLHHLFHRWQLAAAPKLPRPSADVLAKRTTAYVDGEKPPRGRRSQERGSL
jgi:hypothetical protein